MKAKTDEFLAASTIKARGWTEALIKRFLGNPDETRANPHYISGAPMKLYKKRRVVKAEKSAKFLTAQALRNPKREAAKKGVATKQSKTDEYVDKVGIEIPKLTREALIRAACDHYNARTRGDYTAIETSDRDFLDRICVNYLRHRLTKYDRHVAEIANKVGASYAKFEIKKKVLDAIAKEYDWLADECGRQAMKAYGEWSYKQLISG